MTRCCRDINLKSSVYNQTGQSYVEQQSLNRCMCTHIRRVLLAKSRVDSRNPRYISAMQRRKPIANCKLRFSGGCTALDSEFIDKLAYDTEHHPAELIKITCRSKSSSKDRSLSRDRQQQANNNCPCSRDHSPNKLSPCKDKKKFDKLYECNIHHGNDNERQSMINVYCPCAQSKDHSPTKSSPCKDKKKLDKVYECRIQRATDDINGEKQAVTNVYCTPKSEGTPPTTNRSRKYARESESIERCRDSSASSEQMYVICPGLNSAAIQCEREIDDNCLKSTEEERKREAEEACYAKFVYDITQEIVQNGLYTDEELREVFKKHLERCTGVLNKRKMQYEIYQLKISLNMEDDSDEDEMETDLVYAEKFKNHRVPKPPTPPKVLNENKVIDKLMSYKQLDEISKSGVSTPRRGSFSNKSVIFIDANPEFLITERDFLSTLMDHHVDPEKIQRIYKNLLSKCKDMTLCEAVQVGSEVAENQRIDKCCSPVSIHSTCMTQGILRKDAKDYDSKSSSPETTSYRLNYIKNKQNEAFEKCAKLEQSLCLCKIQPCVVHRKSDKRRESEKDAEHEKSRRTSKVSIKEEPPSGRSSRTVSSKESKSPRPSPRLSEKRILSRTNAPDQRSSKSSSEGPKSPRISSRSNATEDGLPSQRSSKSKSTEEEEKPPQRFSKSFRIKDVTPSPDSEVSEIPEEKVGEPSKIGLLRRSAYNNEFEEEIEEEIESDIDDSSPRKSPRRSTVSENDEEKLSSVPEEDEEHDVKSDYSDSSDISSESSKKGDESSKSSTSKVNSKESDVRYSSMKDYFKKFATVDENKVWRISEGSSDSSSGISYSDSRAKAEISLRNEEEEDDNNNTSSSDSKKDYNNKKRKSSGMSGKKVYETWNQRLSDLSSHFYDTSAENKYCDVTCRPNPNVKSCSDTCKYVRINCRNLSKPTECLIRVTMKSEDSASSSS